VLDQVSENHKVYPEGRERNKGTRQQGNG